MASPSQTQTSQIDLSSYKSLFLQAAREHIDNIRSCLLMIRLNPEDQNSLTKLRISSHSLKGQNMAMGYVKTGTYCRLLEYIFRDVLEKKLTLTPEIINTLKEAITQVEISLAAIEKDDHEVDLLSQEKTLEKLTGVKIPVN